MHKKNFFKLNHHFLVKFFLTSKINEFKLNLGLIDKTKYNSNIITILDLYKIKNYNSYFLFPELLNKTIKIHKRKELFNLFLNNNNINFKFKNKIGMFFNTRFISNNKTLKIKILKKK